MNIEVTELGKLVAEHKWVAVSSIVIGIIVRLLKTDTKIPLDVPPKYRVWLALVLGIASGGLQKVSEGTPWRQALLDGLVSAALAVLGHNIVVDSLRGGREFIVPGLTLPGVAPAPGKPFSIPPPPATPDV